MLIMRRSNIAFNSQRATIKPALKHRETPVEHR
jgi:hypothetical protein